VDTPVAKFQIHEVSSSARQYRASLNASEYTVKGASDDEEVIVTKKIPWRDLVLSNSIETTKRPLTVPNQQELILCATGKVNFFAECIPNELIGLIGADQDRIVFCDTCKQQLSSSSIEELILKFTSSSNTTVIAVCISAETLLVRDGVSWELAKDFYQVSRVIEDGILKSSNDSKHPQYLVIDTISLSSMYLDTAVSENTLRKKIEDLLHQHGLLTFFDFTDEVDSLKRIHRQETIFSNYYCPICSKFTVTESHRSRELNLSIDDIKNFSLNSETKNLDTHNKVWVEFLVSPIVQRLIDLDKDFKRFLKSVRIFLEHEFKYKEKFLYIELSNSLWVPLVDPISNLFSKVQSNLIIYNPQPNLSNKEEGTQAITLVNETTYRFEEDTGISTLLNFGNIDSLLINRFKATPYARQNSITTKMLQEAFHSLQTDAAENSMHCFYLSINIESLYTATISELSKLLHLDKEICDLLDLLDSIGLGSCTLRQKTSLLLAPEKQRLWLCQKILGSKRRRQTMTFVIKDIESDLGPTARLAVHKTIQQLLKKNNVVFKAINETGKELYVRYA
jgi:hypothetical protein